MARREKLTKAIRNTITGNLKKAGQGVEDTTKKVASPSPSPMTNLILADVLLRTGGQLLRNTVEAGLLGQKYGKGKAKRIIRGRSMAQTLLGTAVARIATRSVPGAIVVGGGLLAKTLYDRRRSAKAREEGKEAVEEQADNA